MRYILVLVLFISSLAHGSSYFWACGTTPGSKYFWDNGASAGSKYFWLRGDGPGSQYFWDKGDKAGSLYYWNKGDGPGSDYYYRKGDGPGSHYYWVYGNGPGSMLHWQKGHTSSFLPYMVPLCLSGKVRIPLCDILQQTLARPIPTNCVRQSIMGIQMLFTPLIHMNPFECNEVMEQ